MAYNVVFYIFQLPYPYKTTVQIQPSGDQLEGKLSLGDVTKFGVDFSGCAHFSNLRGEFVEQWLDKRTCSAIYAFEYDKKATVGAASAKEIIMPTLECRMDTFCKPVTNVVLPDIFHLISNPRKIVVHKTSAFTNLMKLCETMAVTKKVVSKEVQEKLAIAVKAVEQCSECVTIKPEIMFNEFYVNRLILELERIGKNYTVISQKEGFILGRYSLYANSRVDFGICKGGDDVDLVAGMVMLTIDEDEGGGLHGASGDAQIVAGALQIGTDLAVRTLRFGKIVDLVQVFGLSLSLESNSCRIYKLVLNFQTSKSQLIKSSDTISLKDGFERIVNKIN